MYLFDSSAIIDWMYSNRLGKYVTGPISVSTISLSELLPTAKEKGKTTLDATNRFCAHVRKIGIDEPIAREAAHYKYELRRRGEEKAMIDLIIAASAKLNDLTLVTLDNDFEVLTSSFDIDLLDIDF